MYCPSCKTEYREGFTICADCKINLIAEIPMGDEDKKITRLNPIKIYAILVIAPFVLAAIGYFNSFNLDRSGGADVSGGLDVLFFSPLTALLELTKYIWGVFDIRELFSGYFLNACILAFWVLIGCSVFEYSKAKKGAGNARFSLVMYVVVMILVSVVAIIINFGNSFRIIG